jgi:ring-1,2-phenylacetyl-CoA epoxidase subunit PaaE
LFAIASAVLGAEPESRVTFLLANRSAGRIMLRRELDELGRQYPHRLRLVHVLDQDAQAPQVAGPLDAPLLHRLGARLDLAGVDEVYLCGPGPLTDTVQLGLTDLGVDPGRIHCELFSAPVPAARSGSAVGDAIPGGPGNCTVVIGGRSVRIAGGPSESVLDAGLRAGLPLPYSCRAGYCGTCAAVVTPASDPDGQASGEVVRTCQTACPATPVTVDFDRVADRATTTPR